jgi:catalase
MTDAQRPAPTTTDAGIPVNAPKLPVQSYSAAGHMRYQLATDPVYSPNSKGGPRADTARYGQPAGWHTDGDMVRTAYTLRSDDDDWGQAGTLVRDVLNDAERGRLVDNIANCSTESSNTFATSTWTWANASRRVCAPDSGIWSPKSLPAVVLF